MANSERIYLIQGNDTDMSVCLRKGGDDPLPYDLTGASRIGLALTGHGLSFFVRDIVVSGEDNNIISGVLAGDLLTGEYGLEVSFVLGGKAKRFRVPQVFEVVTYLAEDQDGTAEGEGDGISITVTVQPEIIEIAGPTGPQGRDGKSAYEVWLDEGHTGDEDDFFKWLASEGLPWNDVDISSLTVRNGYITSSGVWNSGSTYCHTLLPVSAGKAVRVTAAESNLFRYAWLTSGQAPRGGIAADLVPGTERTDVAAGSSVSLAVPDGAKYLYVYLGTPAAKANTPESMAVSDTIASLRKDTDTNAGDIAVLGEEARHSGVYGHFDGAGTSVSDGGNIYVVAGMSYRLTMLHPDITVTDPTGNVWRLVVSAMDDSGAVVSNLVQVSDVSPLSDHYDLTIPSGATRLYIYGRCSEGQTCDYVLERLDTVTYNDGDILTLNPDSEFQPKWQSAAKPYYTSQNTNRPNCVRFLHLSDVHGNWANVRRFLKFYNHWVDKGYDITAINTGDTATDYLTDGVTGYTSINGVDKILGVVGNHDTRGTSGWQQYKGLEVYNALFAPLISGWGVVQPEGAAENGYCYYYKDYATNKLRLVVVDIMGYDDTEDAWLASALASAKTAGYHVLIATHFAGGRSSAEASQPPYKKIDCQWSTMAGLASDSTQLNGYNSESYKMADTVHAFMEDGGIFCGYMCGHSHLEFIARLDKYPDQMVYTVGSSKSGKVHDYTHTTGTRMQDEFEIVAVDTDSKFVKLYKVGANYDRRGRLKDSVCVSYDTHEVVGFPVTSEGVKTINGQSILGSGNIGLNGGNIDYTGEEGDAAVIHGESIDYNIKALDDMAAYLSNNKQWKINDLDTIRAGAAAGATAYQKPSGGIPASDIASGVIPTLVQSDWNEDDDGDYAYIKNKPTDIVKYTSQSLTDAQKEQARANIGAADAAEVSQLRSDMIEEDKTFTPTWDKVGKYLSLSGGVSTSAAWSISAPFILQKGWTLKVRTEGSGATIIAATTDGTTYTPLVVSPSGDGSLKWFKYTAEADISVAISAKVGQNNVEIYTNGLGLVTALDSDMYGDTIILTGNARSYLYLDEPIPAGDIIQSASGITATGFYLIPASGTSKWVYLFELPYTCEFDVARIEVNNPNLDTYNITVKHPGVREMIEDKSRVIGDYLFPGYPLAVSAGELSKSLSDILDLNTSPMTVYATANNYALKSNSLSAQDSNSKIDKYSVTQGDVLYLKLTKDNDAVYQFQNAASIPASYENTALIGPTVTESCEGLVVVPEGATYLMVSSLKTNTTNSVKKVLTDNIPGYVEAEKERVYNLLVSRSSGDVHIAAFNTDQHFDLDRIGGNGTYDPRWVMQGVKAMLEIANKLPIDQVVFGGDVAGYNGVTSADVDGIFKTVNYLLEPASAIDTVVVGIPGNHDAYQNNANVTAAGMHNAYAKKNERHTYFHGNGADNCDAYWDDTTHKIRTIFIDTYSTNVRTEDFRVFLESALSTLPTGYNALIFSHNPLTNEFAGTILAQKISDPTVEIDAFQNPSDCHAILNQYAGKIIACISGHTHFDAYGISSSGILYIETTSAAPHTHNYTTENIPNTPTVGTVTDTAFDFFVIDQETLTIEALRYGLGCNRKWVYKGANIGQVSGYPQEIVRQ